MNDLDLSLEVMSRKNGKNQSMVWWKVSGIMRHIEYLGNC